MISSKTKYGLKALMILSEEYAAKRPILISELAKKERIPKKFLEHILLELKNKGILYSKKGKGGGYSLSKKPEQISVGAVIRVLEGTLSPLPCLSQTAYHKCDECRDETTCAIRMVMKEVREATASILDGTSLREMLDQSKASEEAPMYAI